MYMRKSCLVAFLLASIVIFATSPFAYAGNTNLGPFELGMTESEFWDVLPKDTAIESTEVPLSSLYEPESEIPQDIACLRIQEEGGFQVYIDCRSYVLTDVLQGRLSLEKQRFVFGRATKADTLTLFKISLWYFYPKGASPEDLLGKYMEKWGGSPIQQSELEWEWEWGPSWSYGDYESGSTYLAEFNKWYRSNLTNEYLSYTVKLFDKERMKQSGEASVAENNKKDAIVID